MEVVLEVCNLPEVSCQRGIDSLLLGDCVGDASARSYCRKYASLLCTRLGRMVLFVGILYRRWSERDHGDGKSNQGVSRRRLALKGVMQYDSDACLPAIT